MSSYICTGYSNHAVSDLATYCSDHGVSSSIFWILTLHTYLFQTRHEAELEEKTRELEDATRELEDKTRELRDKTRELENTARELEVHCRFIAWIILL